MRFGICTDIQAIAEVESLGFDYLETKLNALAALSEKEFAEVCKLVGKSGIGVERCCLLLPKSMAVIGPAYVKEDLVAYLHLAFARMQKIGCPMVVFGSGKSRAIPSGMRYQDAFSQLVEVTKILGQIASEYAIQIVIEPLNRQETNLINSLTEGAALEAMVGLANVGLLADAFHMRKEGQSMSDIALVAPLMHAHIATLDGRRYPLHADEEVMEFFAALRESGYDQSVSIEGKSEDWQKDAMTSLAVMRSL